MTEPTPAPPTNSAASAAPPSQQTPRVGSDMPPHQVTDLEAQTQPILARMNELLKKIEDAQAKADNEALRAYQAKQAVEEHSNVASQRRGEIDALAASLSKLKAEMEEASKGALASKTAAEADLNALNGFRKSAEEVLAAISKQQAQSTVVCAEVEAVKRSMAEISEQVRDAAAQVEMASSSTASQDSEATKKLEAITLAVAQISTFQEQSKAAAEAVRKMQGTVQSQVAELDRIVGSLKEAHSRVEENESETRKAREAASDLQRRIEGLLPGATSAGLASAFRVQKERFHAPRKQWMICFAASLGGLFAVSLISLVAHWGETAGTWDAILRPIVRNLPLAIPFIWFAVYSGRQHMLAKRMEEEYAEKEAISTAFEGYKREMISIGSTSPGKAAPLEVLCFQVLVILGRRPGRIYEGKQEDITPLNVLGQGVQGVLGERRPNARPKEDADGGGGQQA